METIFTNIKERILHYTDIKGFAKEKFFEDLGVTYGNFKGQAKEKALSSDVLAKIVTKYPDINPEWLLIGKEPIFKESDIKPSNNLIPLYGDVSTIGGSQYIASMDPVGSPTDYIDAGDWFPGATAAIRHYSDSMEEYPSGSILVLKEVNDRTIIIYGRNYCIETIEYRITKRLQKGLEAQGYVIAYSTNQATYNDGKLIHEPIDIPLNSIKKLWLVIGCITKEFSSGPVQIYSSQLKKSL